MEIDTGNMCSHKLIELRAQLALPETKTKHTHRIVLLQGNSASAIENWTNNPAERTGMRYKKAQPFSMVCHVCKWLHRWVSKMKQVIFNN